MGTYDTIGGTARHDPAFDENEFACLECAKANGYTEEEVERCDEGDLQCKGCPWLEDMREEIENEMRANEKDD